jgi:hydrogenase expression/formation protein HypC
MCIAVPGKIKKIEGRKALLDYPGEKRFALIGGDPVKVGDYVMVQMGIIVKILSQDEAQAAIEAWKE